MNEPVAHDPVAAPYTCHLQMTGKAVILERMRMRGTILGVGVAIGCAIPSCSTSGDSTATNAGGAGGSHGGPDAGDASDCVPRTCVQLGASCGDLIEPCGTVISCGACSQGQTCGATAPNQCGQGSCAPKTCAQLGASCGMVGDYCSSVVDCGECPEGTTCGATTPNQCGASGTGGTGGSAGTGGTGGCAPQCTGKECGPDGCGADCLPGCALDEQCTAAGQCVACATTWKTPAGEHLSAIALQPGGSVYVGGGDASLAWVAALSPCTGEVETTRPVSVAGASSSRVMGLALSGDNLFAVGWAKTGDDPNEGLWARLSTTDLTVTWSTLLHGSDQSDELWGVGVVAGGPVWLGGTSHVATTSKPWGVRGDMTGAACGFTAAAGAGLVRAVSAAPSGVYFTGAVDGAAFVQRFDPSACSTSSPCDCPAAWSVQSIRIGAAYTEPRSILRVGNTLYLGGFSLEESGSSDYAAFITRVSATDGTVEATWSWNASAVFDAVLGLATDGQSIYATTTTGQDGVSLGTGSAFVGSFPLDLSATVGPAWAVELPFMDLAWGVAADTEASGGVYFTGATESSGWVVRCTKDGQCPL